MGATEECKDLPGRTYEYCIAQFAAFEGEMTVSFIRRPVLQKGLIQTTTDGQTKPMDFFDKQRMRRIYEKFILEYYRKEHPEIQAPASQIPWDINDGYSEILPVMKSDIMLKKQKKYL